MTMFLCGIGATLAVAFLWELCATIRHNKAQRGFAHKHQTQTERAGSVEHFKRVMGRADEIE
jgi:hypothetical protein